MLTDTIEELKKEIAEQEKKEAEAIEAPDAPEEKEVEAPEPKPEEKPTEPEAKPAEEPKVEAPEEKLDNAGYARLRREKAAEKKRADAAEEGRLAAEAELAEMKRPIIEEERQAAPIDHEIEEVKQAVRMSKAEREFQSLEQTFRRKTPEYDAISSEYAAALAQSIRIQNPRLSSNEIGERTKESILIKAANFMKNGFDPIEELFYEAKDLGFTGKSQQKQEIKKEEATPIEEDIKPDMKKLAANRAKSTGMTATNGKSEGQMTKAAAADLSVENWAKLPQAEKRRLLYG